MTSATHGYRRHPAYLQRPGYAVIQFRDPSGGMKERILEGFGPRLRDIRLAKGLTQEELGEKVGVSQRVVAYYEQEGAQPPGALLVDLAQALRISADELLGLKTPKEKVSPKISRLRKRLRRVESLPPDDQKSVLKLVDLLAQNQRIKSGR